MGTCPGSSSESVRAQAIGGFRPTYSYIDWQGLGLGASSWALDTRLRFWAVGRIKIDACTWQVLLTPSCAGPVRDESALGGQALCPQVSVLGRTGQEGRQGHGVDEGGPPDQVTELHRISR